MSDYLVTYRHEGAEFSLILPADSWDDALSKLRSVSQSGRITGANVTQVPVNALTLPFAGLVARLVVWWRNVLR